MYIRKENERLYLSSWNYNAALIMTELAKIVENNGGKVKPIKTALVSNRTIDENLHKYADRKVQLENCIADGRHNEKTLEALKETTRKIEELQAVNNEPVKVTHTTYIKFSLDGYVYYYQLEENPFFNFMYSKTPLKGNVYSLDACIDEANKDWLYDCFLRAGCAHADIVEAANLIFNQLTNAKPTPIIRGSKRQRVQNTYNNGYHYETVYSRERTAVIDW